VAQHICTKPVKAFRLEFRNPGKAAGDPAPASLSQVAYNSVGLVNCIHIAAWSSLPDCRARGTHSFAILAIAEQLTDVLFG
jgi:hypothetical protein